jgi:predicted secreted Zn-dependent protease
MPDDVKLDIKTNEPKVTHYKVAGATLKEALKQLQKRDEWGTYDSTQNQKSGAKIDGDGKVKSVTLTLNPTIELPEWSGYSKASKAQRKAWDDMVAKLEKHERNHHKIQKDALEDLKKKIKAAKSLDRDVLDDLISKNSEGTQKQQDAYDSRTGHGEKEGVELDTDADGDSDD